MATLGTPRARAASLGAGAASLGLGLGWKLAGAIAIPMLALATTLVVFFTARSDMAVRHLASDTSLGLGRVLANNVKDMLLLGDKLGAEASLAAMSEGTSVSYATVRTAKGEVFAGVHPEADPVLTPPSGAKEAAEERGGTLHVVTLIGDAAAPSGSVHLGVSLALAQREGSTAMRVGIVALLVAGLLGVALGRVLGRYFAEPVRAMAEASAHIAGGDLTRSVAVRGSDEVGLLARAFADMLESQRAIVVAIKRSADALSSLSGELVGVGTGVSQGFAVIQSRADESAAATTRLATSLRGVADNVVALHATTATGTASIGEVAKASREVLDRVEEMRASVESTSSAISQSASSIRVIASSIAEINGVLEETVAAMASIGEATTRVRDDAADTARLSEEASSDARQGGAVVKETVSGIQRIDSATHAVSVAISALVESSQRITAAISVIDEVTDQTALLALNAAIIAAQAGEHGRGFSVVADEIKALADRTRRSTGEIASLTKDLSERSNGAMVAMAQGQAIVRDGIELATRADAAFERIVRSSGQAADRMHNVAEATASQETATERAHELVAKISGSMRRLHSASSEQHRGAMLITRSAEDMRELTAKVHTVATQQAERSERVNAAIEDIAATIDHVEQMQRAQTADSQLVQGAAQAIAEITGEQRGSVRRLEAVIASLDEQVKHFQAAVQRYRV